MALVICKQICLVDSQRDDKSDSLMDSMDKINNKCLIAFSRMDYVVAQENVVRLSFSLSFSHKPQ